MTPPLYAAKPGHPPCWLRKRELEQERRHLRLMLAAERLQKERMKQ